MLESAKVGQALRSALPSRVAPPAARRHITPPEPHAHVHRRCARPAQVWRPRRPLVCERAHWHRDPGSTTSSRRPRSEHQQVASRSPLLACACPPSRACQALCSLVCLGTGQLTRAVLCIAGFAVASVTVASVRRPPLRLLPRRCLGLETVALVMVALVRRPLLLPRRCLGLETVALGTVALLRHPPLRLCRLPGLETVRLRRPMRTRAPAR